MLHVNLGVVSFVDVRLHQQVGRAGCYGLVWCGKRYMEHMVMRVDLALLSFAGCLAHSVHASLLDGRAAQQLGASSVFSCLLLGMIVTRPGACCGIRCCLIQVDAPWLPLIGLDGEATGKLVGRLAVRAECTAPHGVDLEPFKLVVKRALREADRNRKRFWLEISTVLR